MQEALYGPGPISFMGGARILAGDEDATRRTVRSAAEESPEELAALLALSHSSVEHKLYCAIAAEAAETGACALTVRSLMSLTGLGSYSTIRRGLAGLIAKLSVERKVTPGAARAGSSRTVYAVFPPREIFARRKASGIEPYPREIRSRQDDAGFRLAVRRVAERHELSRREGQVALSCVEGLTNAEIGEKLYISEQTVKFHLRQIFTKLRVRRRAELISLLLRP